MTINYQTKIKEMKIYSTAIILILLFSSCNKITGEGPMVTEHRNVANFSGIDLRCSANVYFKEDSIFKIEASAQQNILDVMETVVSGNQLIVKYRNDVKVRSSEPITIVIAAPEINSLRISGSGNINCAETLEAATMNLDISGSGNILLTAVNADKLNANISGSGDSRINSGTIDEEKLVISGTGNIKLQNVLAAKSIATISGSGNIYINVLQQLDATISGSGSVFYKGNPVVNITNSGSGKVSKF
jgi:hypothetical protein